MITVNTDMEQNHKRSVPNIMAQLQELFIAEGFASINTDLNDRTWLSCNDNHADGFKKAYTAILYFMKAIQKFESHWCRVRTQVVMRLNGILPVGVASSDVGVQDMARDDCLVMFVVRRVVCMFIAARKPMNGSNRQMRFVLSTLYRLII